MNIDIFDLISQPAMTGGFTWCRCGDDSTCCAKSTVV
jgi:hypothetical protein